MYKPVYTLYLVLCNNFFFLLNLQNLQMEESRIYMFLNEEEISCEDYQPIYNTCENPTSSLKFSNQHDQHLQSIIGSDCGFVKTSEGFKCSICSYKSKYKSILLQHMPTHTKTKPYKCKFCYEGFTQRSSLYRHCRKHMVQNT